MISSQNEIPSLNTAEPRRSWFWLFFIAPFAHIDHRSAHSARWF
jgi:hypothetical protein